MYHAKYLTGICDTLALLSDCIIDNTICNCHSCATITDFPPFQAFVMISIKLLRVKFGAKIMQCVPGISDTPQMTILKMIAFH